MMIKRVSALLATAGLATAGLLGAGTAQAAPGHLTLQCDTYDSTGWVQVVSSAPGDAPDAIVRGEICMTVKAHGTHEDVTYWARDLACDGYGLVAARDLSYVADGYQPIVTPEGCGDTEHANKAYPRISDERSVRLRAISNAPRSTFAYTDRLYWELP
jgi:hypothetical protein